MNFFDMIKRNRPIVMDGSMGVLLFSRVPEYRGCFELLNAEMPDVIASIHRDYLHAGAEIIETNTFGGSRIKLDEYSLGKRCHELNARAVEIARKESAGKALVAGCTGPTGKLVEPMGDFPCEEIYDSYAEQMKAFSDAGADLIVVETMSDFQEAKLALLAAKHFTKLPVVTSITLENNGKTISGTDIVTGFAGLAAHGADAVGANCGLGPATLLDIFKNSIDELEKIGVPLAVWSNNGLPVIENGKAFYKLSAEEFAKLSYEFAGLGVKIIGGCCGTTPEHIRCLSSALKTVDFPNKEMKRTYNFATSRFASYNFEKSKTPVKIGERLNPSARKQFALELKEGRFDFLRNEAKAQQSEGADLLDINVGLPDIDEVASMKQSVAILSGISKAPLMIDSDNPVVIEAALKMYPGVAVVNSVNGKRYSLEGVVPVLKKYGCFVVALCLDESGIHREASKRIEAGEKLLSVLESEGISKDRVIVDPLMLSESAEPGAAMETLKVISHFKSKGIKTSLGISNVSYGLPERKHVNNVFLKLAVESGLTCAIISTATVKTIEKYTEEERLALDFITGNDPNAVRYIEKFKKTQSQVTVSAVKAEKDDPLQLVCTAVIEGNTGRIEELVKAALSVLSPQDIMNKALIKGLEVVGDLYSRGEYFLPQMISSANAMKLGFQILKPLLSSKSADSMGTIVISTVKGDIHDIGKNIVAMMMENHGFTVYDLGKDVDSEIIIGRAVEVDADIICLSSLLTTTMPEMKKISELIAENGYDFKLMVGGAVVTEDYAVKIGAYYSADAVSAVACAKKLMNG